MAALSVLFFFIYIALIIFFFLLFSRLVNATERISQNIEMGVAAWMKHARQQSSDE